ncbi:LADA_0E11518g1_1 [Lachancea dasiensis]|uniref:ferroxidase n=1 Tax=Lachancea dasiensis TaxID=1072105 RepID=A0A1G4JF60_9SACH|nr:LADA_0E11518g1_1 [Lachancea dasiensis]
MLVFKRGLLSAASRRLAKSSIRRLPISSLGFSGFQHPSKFRTVVRGLAMSSSGDPTHNSNQAVKTSSGSSTDGNEIPQEVLNLSSDEYHTRSDQFLETLQDQLEQVSDSYPQLIPDVELTQGVMTLTVATVGTYVLNKQPPNKQIWLSSPVSGPNRFDLYRHRWVSLRNGQDLLQLLNQELNAVMPEPVELQADQ